MTIKIIAFLRRMFTIAYDATTVSLSVLYSSSLSNIPVCSLETEINIKIEFCMKYK
jgi:hypothetical protein